MENEEITVRFGGPVFEALISIYGAQGLFDQALRVFELINGQVDGPCLHSILLACGTVSPPRWEVAIAILHSSDIVAGTTGPGKIDQKALSNTIIACCKANQYEEGLNLLRLYGALPNQR